MSDRCTRSNANAAWTCVLPEGHEGDHIYTLWSEIAIHAEAAAQRVRDVCMSSHVDDKGKRVVFLDRIQRAIEGADHA